METIITPEEAKATLKQEQDERIKRCANKLAQLLDEENCTLSVAMIVTTQGNVPHLQIVSK